VRDIDSWRKSIGMLVDLIMLAAVLKVGLGLLFSELNLGLTFCEKRLWGRLWVDWFKIVGNYGQSPHSSCSCDPT
jgi:hypothetical protein